MCGGYIGGYIGIMEKNMENTIVPVLSIYLNSQACQNPGALVGLLGYSFGGPKNKDYSLLGSTSGSPRLGLGNHHLEALSGPLARNPAGPEVPDTLGPRPPKGSKNGTSQ